MPRPIEMMRIVISYWVVPADLESVCGKTDEAGLPWTLTGCDEFMGGKTMRLTRHNGRSGLNGVYNPKHNDRRFDVENSDHIDSSRTGENVYWDCCQGFHYAENREDAEQIIHSFEEIEMLYYWEHYEDYCNAQHERNRKTGHTERNRSPDDLRLDKKTCPEETVYQIGTREEHISGEMLRHITADFFEEFEKRFGKHVHILNWSLHMDEGTPHIHERHVFDCLNRYGEICPQQEKALEALGIEMPFPDKKRGKMNNRKVAFDAACRSMMFDITKRYGLELDEEPEYGGRAHLEKQDYIIMKQQQVISENKSKLKEIEEKKQDVQFELLENNSRLKRKQRWVAEATQELDELIQKISEAKEELEKTGTETEVVKTDLERVRRKNREEEEKFEEIQEAVQTKQKELTVITARVENTEQFIEKLSDAAYEKAVETVTEKVVKETHNMDFEVIEQFREKMKTNLPYEFRIRKMVYDVTAILMEEFQGVTQAITTKIRSLLSDGHMNGIVMETIRERLKFGPPMTDTEEREEQKQEPQAYRRHCSR